MGGAGMIDVSIIIVSWNARNHLLNCLRSVHETISTMTCEIIVVDNGSTDGSPQAVREEFPQVKLLEQGANLGFAKGNNIGLEHASGRYDCLMNSDIVVQPGCLQALVEFMDANPVVGLCGPRLLNGDGTPQPSCRRFPSLRNHLGRALFLNRSLADPAYLRDAVSEVEVLAGSFWVARPRTVAQVGKLDERFFIYGEDLDWCRRLRKAGWKLCFCPAARAFHFGGASSSADPSRFNRELQHASLQLWEKYHGKVSTLAYLLIGVLSSSLRMAGNRLVAVFTSGRDGRHRKARQHRESLRWLLQAVAARVRPDSGNTVLQADAHECH
jgi:GT2 family glycosyltransferase